MTCQFVRFPSRISWYPMIWPFQGKILDILSFQKNTGDTWNRCWIRILCFDEQLMTTKANRLATKTLALIFSQTLRRGSTIFLPELKISSGWRATRAVANLPSGHPSHDIAKMKALSGLSFSSTETMRRQRSREFISLRSLTRWLCNILKAKPSLLDNMTLDQARILFVRVVQVACDLDERKPWLMG